ncbi:unnamed protein product [Adineta steineri]|uniref:Neuroendocrine protein 7B2 n=1 Tax=Adineta steineri TaxID=433720 RepID=A0A814HYY0_9BILA|nr:unnamed protein product [Adineta steineri]CAF1016549.1 unnamed protein product [Adineta steineri]CAF3799881.1 unnamed protein product [Adineta steineri]CAF4030045.1 unnamed protein product [Adineta steineri]
MWYGVSTFTTTVIILIISKSIQGTDWNDYGEASSNVNTAFDDDSDQYLSALTRDQEQEIHSPFITGYKYVSGGAGEGRQHLSPSGQIPNHPEVKTDEELPSYCNPPNPCPLGFEADDCDASPMTKFNGEYSRLYQTEQDCQCDNDHDECFLNRNIYDVPLNGASKDVLKRARRVRRNLNLKQKNENATKPHYSRPPYHKGQTLRFHVAKKSPIHMTS